MGFFSWKTSDTQETIWNEHCGDKCKPVKMLLPDGSVIIEESYEGYGVFGGIDFYEAVSTLNGYAPDRGKGISLMDVNYHESAPRRIIAPKLVSIGCTKTYAELPDSESCSSQGFFG